MHETALPVNRCSSLKEVRRARPLAEEDSAWAGRTRLRNREVGNKIGRRSVSMSRPKMWSAVVPKTAPFVWRPFFGCLTTNDCFPAGAAAPADGECSRTKRLPAHASAISRQKRSSAGDMGHAG